MVLYPWIREYIRKYSFIKTTDFKKGSLYIYYDNEGKSKYRKLPYRSTKDQLISCIDSIKKEINYEEKHKKEWKKKLKEKATKDAGFAYTN